MKLSYRSEIDGLRTIAVLSVILYHAQIVVFGHDFFKGGFVGVDIFFVISGYLISRILLSELFEKGKISFFQFYERRARRILPILFTVFIVSFPLAYKYLLPNQFIEYAHSILSATFFGSNIFFYFTNTQYGAEDSLLQPFLHTWSLGVEEQFYILFPIVLLLAYKFAKNHLITIIAVLILISLQYADYNSAKNTQLNFFMLTSRLWELGIGSLLALYELKYGRVKHELLNQTIPLLGIAMIVYAIVFFNNQTSHPSFITLLPTIGTALIILYSVNKTDLVGRVLGWKPIIGIGLISYSMYLWHYPLFAFARIADTNGLHNDEKYLLILLTFVLSIVSYFLIEKPFRNKQFLNIKKFSVAILLLLIAVLGMNWKVVETKGFEERVPKILLKKRNDIKSILIDLKIDGTPCHNRTENFCEVGNNNKGVIQIVGDSMAASLQKDLVDRLSNDYLLVSMTKGGQILLKNGIRIDGETNKKIPQGNLDYQNKRLQQIIKYPNSTVIVFGRTPLHLERYRFDNKEGGFEGGYCCRIEPLNGKTIEQTIKEPIEDLLNEGFKVILLYPFAEGGWNVPNVFFQKPRPPSFDLVTIKKWLNENQLSYMYDTYLERTKSTYKIYDEIEHKNLRRVYPHQINCDNIVKGRCVMNDENNLFYADAWHPNDYGASMINDLIIKEIYD